MSPELLAEIHKWYSEGADQDDVVERLRLRTMPSGYKIHTWREVHYSRLWPPLIHSCIGKDETKVEKLHSILAKLEYTHCVNLLNSKGVHFKNHLYVPEVHPITGVEFCEREYESHVFKVHTCM